MAGADFVADGDGNAKLVRKGAGAFAKRRPRTTTVLSSTRLCLRTYAQSRVRVKMVHGFLKNPEPAGVKVHNDNAVAAPRPRCSRRRPGPDGHSRLSFLSPFAYPKKGMMAVTELACTLEGVQPEKQFNEFVWVLADR